MQRPIIIILIVLVAACEGAAPGAECGCNRAGLECDQGDWTGGGLNPEDIIGYTSASNGLTLYNISDMADLSGLECLSEAKYLQISSCEFESLDGLNCLETIDEHLELSGNHLLSNLDALGCLTSVGSLKIGSLSYYYSTTCTGNDSLSTLDGLRSLASIENQLRIWYNASLLDLRGLEKIEIVDSIVIEGNASLSSLSGLENLTSVPGYLYILQNDSLVDLQGLNSLSQVGFDLFVNQNNSLKTLSGLSNLSSVNYLVIEDNPVLETLEGLTSLVTVGEALRIVNNPNLPYCEICYLLDQFEADFSDNFDPPGNLEDECWVDGGLICP